MKKLFAFTALASMALMMFDVNTALAAPEAAEGAAAAACFENMFIDFN